jgi:two-component system sensor histidine kinase/response regulator
MADSTTPPDWMARLDRYVFRLIIAWTGVILLSFAWNAAQHMTAVVGIPSNLPLVAEIIGHGGIWLVGVIGLRLGTQQFRRQLAERARIEAALRDSEERYRVLVEQSPTSIVITDLNGTIEYVNPKFTQVTGYSAEEAIGQNPRILKSGEMSPAQYKDLWDTVLSGREWRGELHNRRKDGVLYWESASISAIRDSRGRIVRLLAVKEDITERKAAEAAEREQRSLAEALRDTVADLNSTLEFDSVLERILFNVGRVVPHDEANIMLISGDDAYVCQSRGKTPRPVLVASLRISETAHLRQMMETGAPLIISDVSTQASWRERPESRWIRSYLSVPIRAKGETVGFINLDSATPNFFTEAHAARLAIFADQAATAVHNARLYQQAQTELAERRRIEAELQQAKEAAEAASQAKGAFLANMSHELRTPLNAILGFTQLLARDDNLTPDQRDNLATIQRSGQHLLTLINDVLDMSKIEAGRMALRPENFDLRHMLNDLEEMFRLRATNKHLLLDFDLTPDLPRYIYADEGKLRQVLINLLGNAVKFTVVGGVALRAAYHPDRLSIEVEDSGPGLTAEELTQIFRPFVQVASSQKAHEGTGLGLSISYEFVRLMGGELRVSSVPDHGSVFSFDIPVTLSPADSVPTIPEARRVIGLEPNQPKYRLLIVDDRDTSRRLLVKLLAPLGFDVREAIDGREALAVWEDWRPQLIWMDMRMPVMDGHTATRHIKSSDTGRSTIIIALTASVFQEDREMVLAEGCDDFVRKPFRAEEIFEKLTRHLGVRFIYAESEQPAASPPLLASDQSKMPATALPTAWLAELRQATVAADLDRILALIDQQRSIDPALADQLAQWARNFDYDQILRLTQPTGVTL